MNVKVITSQEEFNTAINENLVLVDFFAEWCGPCKMIAPKIQEFAAKYTDVKFYKVDVDELDELAAEQGIQAMPTFILYKKGQKVDEFKGANAAKLEELIEKNL